MDLDLAQLRALRAAVDAGTLEGAARALHVTPSAISQRLKALEQATGRVLLVRSKQVRVTDPGRAVLRLARELDLLAADTARELAVEGPVVLPVAVNADSLSTWVVPALSPLHDEVLLHCSAPTRTAPRVQRWFPAGPTPAALERAPVVHFDRDDDLQRRWLQQRAPVRVDPPAHHVPSTDGFVLAVLGGPGWGLLSDLQLASPALGSAVVLLDPTTVVDVPLHWQRWKVRSPSLERLSEVVLAGGRRALRQR